MPFSLIPIVLMFVVLCVATDLRSRRIPNVISGTAMLIGVLLNTFHASGSGLLSSVSGLAIVTALLLPVFAVGGIGGGDVKMAGALGALLGLRVALVALWIGAALGGVTAAAHLARRGKLGETLKGMGARLSVAALSRSLAPLRLSDHPGPVALPYAVPLALGALAAIALQGMLSP
jgi:prepilin peptidase CpaA